VLVALSLRSSDSTGSLSLFLSFFSLFPSSSDSCCTILFWRGAPAPPSCFNLFALPVIIEDNRQAVLGRSDDDDFTVLGLRQFFRGLDALPLEEARGDALRDDLLEVGNPSRFDSLSLGLLLLLLEHELHLLALLLALHLDLHGVYELVRQLYRL
jgi:hypothetical protein